MQSVSVHVFFNATGSVHPFSCFSGLQVSMSIIQTAENPKNGKIRAEICASIFKKTLEPVFSKKCYEVFKL